MTFARANILGWAFGETLTSAQMNSVDINTARAVDGFAGGAYSPSAELIWNGPIVIDASAGFGTNEWGLQVTSKGIASGILVNAGAASADGIQATGGAGAIGVVGSGGSNATGVSGTGGAGNALGVLGTGTGNQAGVKGTGVDGPGVHGTTTGDGYAVVAQGEPVPTTEAASLRIVPQSTEPGTLDDGAVWIQNDTNLMYTQLNSLVNAIITNRSIQAPKVMGIIDAGNSFGSPVVRAGDINISGASYVSSRLRVSFTAAFSNVDYFALTSYQSTVAYVLVNNSQTTGYIDIERRDSAGALVSMTLAQDIAVTLVAWGVGGV
jgi:hypothetical protein